MLYDLKCPNCGGRTTSDISVITCPKCNIQMISQQMDVKEESVVVPPVTPDAARHEKQYEWAGIYGMILLEVSEDRFVILTVTGHDVNKRKDGSQYAVRTGEVMYGPKSLRKCMKYVRKHSMPLPAKLNNPTK